MTRRVYISGPYTIGDTPAHCAKAMRAWHQIRDMGAYPMCPHLSMYLHIMRWRSYSDWLEWDLVWLDACDALIRLPGQSHGADVEVKRAQDNGIPVFDNMHDLGQWLNGQQETDHA